MPNLKPLITVLLVFLMVPFAHARQDAQDRPLETDKMEVQLAAFKLERLAQRYAKDLSFMDRPVFVRQLQNASGDTVYSVRTGPFKTAEAAKAFIEEWTPMLPQKPVAMAKDSLRPVRLTPPEQAEKSREAKNASARAEAETRTKTAKEKPAQVAVDRVPAERGDETVRAASQKTASRSATEDKQDKENRDAAASDEDGNDSLWGASGSTETDSGKDKGAGISASGQADLRRQIRELQEQVNTLMEAEEVRSELQATEEEKEEKEEDILSAAGRNYTLLQKGKLGVEYKLDYSYFSYDALREQNIIEHNSNHNVTNTFTVEFPLKDNLSIETAIPYVYKYDKVGTGDSKEINDFNDVDFSLNFQPIKSGGNIPSIILRTVLTCPLGRDPYDINPDTELSTGSGGYAAGGSLSLSKAVDPVMVFGTFSYTYKHPIDDLDFKLGSQTLTRYERGDSLGFSMGVGYSLSYITSLSLGYSYSYTFEAERFFKEAESQTYGTRTESSLSIGTSWRVSKKLRISTSLLIGLADSDYFSLSFRFPYEFDL